MPPSVETAAWYAAVFETIQEVPRGRVTTYAHIARLAGRPEYPRGVGVALKNLPENGGLRFHEGNTPWQRIINSQGKISPRGENGARRQAEALRAEGVQVEQNEMGEYSVDFSSYGWFPEGCRARKQSWRQKKRPG